MLSVRCPSPLRFVRMVARNCSAIVEVEPKGILNVAIIGRPNVGKSTLFNRLIGSNMAIVSPVPGTTRDRREGKGNLAGLQFNVVDTGGLDNRGAVSLQIQQQVQHSFQHSHVMLFMVDSKVGVTSVDEHFIRWMRVKLGWSSI